MTGTQTGDDLRQPPSTASPALADALQQVHVDLIELHLQGKQAQWNLVGGSLRHLHLQLDEIVAAARGLSDGLAERMRAINAVPDGRSATVASWTTLPQFPHGVIETSDVVELISQRMYAVTGSIRRVYDTVDEADPTAADLLHGILERLEQLAWMVSAENRVANRTTPVLLCE